ncbi:MAG: hypothetical protein IJ009_02065 [Clostridia bacterium]|nr:hypothetical protein [Clostridia bacterium]
MNEEEMIMHRFADLAAACYEKGHYTYTDFLGLAEYDLFLRAARDFSCVPYTVFGGAEGCERVMVGFGDEESLGYAAEFPIACLVITPLSPKFAEPLSHRDCLGALMNLGIKRECLGDIVRTDAGIFLFCLDKIASYLCENLKRIRHTDVRVTPCEPPACVGTETETVRLSVASLRADGVIAHAYSLSRADSAALFAARRVFVGGRLTENISHELHEGDLVTVRGLGRFRFGGEVGISKKGKTVISIEKFV